MDQKGQFTIDLLFATLLLLITIISIVSVISSGMDTANNSGFSQAKVVADNVARAVNTVYNNGYGQYLVLELPTGFVYTVTVDSTGVSVMYNNDPNKVAKSSIIPVNKIDLSGGPYITMNPGDRFNITNNNGQIKIIKL